ncbi:MAG: hypothetical protein PHO26_03690 [Dehalococcoidia bacterium]|nr:hypothetical protein [Dehalococcoidia bacterium]MDD5494440.1 hypothetical protein [Dehalococcoidia bacterium]
MNNWYRIGLPVLVAILLVVSAVSITLAVTRDNTVKQVTASGYTAPASTAAPYAKAALCPSCPGYNQEAAASTTGPVAGTTVAYGCRGGGGCGGQCVNGDGTEPGGYYGDGCGRCR